MAGHGWGTKRAVRAGERAGKDRGFWNNRCKALRSCDVCRERIFLPFFLSFLHLLYLGGCAASASALFRQAVCVIVWYTHFTTRVESRTDAHTVFLMPSFCPPFLLSCLRKNDFGSCPNYRSYSVLALGDVTWRLHAHTTVTCLAGFCSRAVLSLPPCGLVCMCIDGKGLNHGDKTVPARVHAAAQPYMFDSGLPGSPRKTPDEKLSPCM